MNFVLMLTGYKGLLFLQKINKNPKFVVCYDNGELDGEIFEKIKKICVDKKISFFEQKNLIGLEDNLEIVEKVFLVGWQYILHKNHEKLVIFHDSYLPERRGFSPTIDALMSRSPYLSASAIEPHEGSLEPDLGDIYCRLKKEIKYPITLKEAFEIVVDLYVFIFNKIINENISPQTIDYNNSTFSVWKDKEDMKIDWHRSSEDILNKIMILGYPYNNAFCLYKSQEVRIKKAELVSDLNITNRADNVGKIWKIENGCPLIICGSGILKLNKVVKHDGADVVFNKLRRRFR